MRKLNVSVDMFGNTKEKEKQKKKKKKKKKEIGNVTMKYLSLSWQASICLAYLLISSFILSFFLSFVFFVLQQGFILWNPISFFCFLCFAARIYSFVFLVLQQGFILWNPISFFCFLCFAARIYSLKSYI